nr:hypothetical protein [Sphaerochaetaceae bacterium]
MRTRVFFAFVLLSVVVVLLTACTHVTKQEAWEKPVEIESSYIVPDKLENLPTQWDLTALYPDHDTFYRDMEKAEKLITSFEKYKGKIATVEGIIAYLNDPDIREYQTLIDKASLYQNLLQNLDAADSWALEVQSRRNSVKRQKTNATEFIGEEISALSLQKRKKLFSDERLKEFAHYFKSYTEEEKRNISDEQQEIIDLYDDIAWETYNIYSVFAYTEMPWPKFTYPDGTEEKLSVGIVNSIMANPNYSQDFRNDLLLLRCSVYDQYDNT